MRNCISYELTKKLAARRAKEERMEAYVQFFGGAMVAFTLLICTYLWIMA